jgi:hypothetical protein
MLPLGGSAATAGRGPGGSRPAPAEIRGTSRRSSALQLGGLVRVGVQEPLQLLAVKARTDRPLPWKTGVPLSEAFLVQFREAGPETASGFSRLAVTLNQASLEELRDRVIMAVLDEFVHQSPEPDAEPYGMLVVIQPPGGPCAPVRCR